MFGIDLIDASLLPAMFVALAAGIISFLSPCVLPIVPPYLAFMSGVSIAEMEAGGRARLRAFTAALFFVLGLSTVFVLLGFTASWLGMFFLQNQILLARISGVVVIVFGLHFLHVFRIPFLDREARIETGDAGGSAFGAYILGLAFAFGWTPCIGPQLGAILSMAASEASVARGTALLAVYAAGLGLPFLPRHGRDEPAQAPYGADRKGHGRAADRRRSRAAHRGLLGLLLLAARDLPGAWRTGLRRPRSGLSLALAAC